MRNALRWKLGRGGTASMGDLADPVTGAPALRICVYDASGAAQPLLAATVPPGGTCGPHACWKILGGAGGYRYRNKAAPPEGVTDLKLRITGLGELQVVAKGKGVQLAMPALGLVPPVTAQLAITDGDASTCWGATFVAASRNAPTLFRAASP